MQVGERNSHPLLGIARLCRPDDLLGSPFYLEHSPSRKVSETARSSQEQIWKLCKRASPSEFMTAIHFQRNLYELPVGFVTRNYSIFPSVSVTPNLS